MQLVIADTGPFTYLALIGHLDLLPALFQNVIVPTAVYAELTSPRAPRSVRDLISAPRGWLEVRADEPPVLDPSLKGLDDGEKAAIALAVALQADLLLMDDREGVAVARGKGLNVTGTLGVLDVAAHQGLVDFAEAMRKLERTNFRRPEPLLAALLAKHEARRRSN